MYAKMLTGGVCLLLAASGCSQNFSEETPAEAIKARGMQRAAQSMPAAKPPLVVAGDRENLDGINVAGPEGWQTPVIGFSISPAGQLLPLLFSSGVTSSEHPLAASRVAAQRNAPRERRNVVGR